MKNRSHESRLGAEDHDAGKVQEVSEYIDREMSRELSEDRKSELTSELVGVVEFMKRGGFEAFLAGGSGLDMIDGEWGRDHQDVDMAIFDDQRASFYEHAISNGFVVTDHERKEKSKDDLLDPSIHNAFLFKSDENGVVQFEIMFLDDGQAEHYKDPQYVEVGGVEVALQPAEIIIYYKIIDGRRKDLADIESVWNTLSEDKKQATRDMLEASGVKIEVGGVTAESVEELISLGNEQGAKKRDEFFEGGISVIESKVQEGFSETAKTMFDVAKGLPDKEAFFDELADAYGGFMPERRELLSSVADYLFEEERTLDQFKKWAAKEVDTTLGDRVNSAAYHGYINQKIWDVSF